MFFNDPPALVSLGIDKIDRIDVDADIESHLLISESEPYMPRFLIRVVSATRRFSDPFWIRSRITSSYVCPGFLSWWTVSHVLGQTGILLVAHFWPVING
jgi:hypothetical protein